MTNSTHTNSDQRLTEAATLEREDLVVRLARFRSKSLTPEQYQSMHEEMSAAVIAAAPTTTETAVAWMTVLSSFLRDSAPSSGGTLWDHLTDVKLASWQGAWLRDGQPAHTLRTRRAILERIIRVHRGGPVMVAKVDARKVRPAPLANDDLTSILEACVAESTSALRGFAAYICANVKVGSHGHRFTVVAGELWLTRSNGECCVVVGFDDTLFNLAGQVLLPDDWDALCRTAFNLRTYLNTTIAIQTFRMLALNDTRRSLGEIITLFGFNEDALSAIAEYLPPIVLSGDAHYRALFRDGVTLVDGVECTASLSATPSPRRSLKGRREETPVPRRISRAETRRLAQKIAAEKSASVMPSEVSIYLDSYLPDEADATWSVIEVDVRAMLHQGGFRSIETARKYAVALTTFLRWRSGQHLATGCPAALTYANIDGFFALGTSHLGQRSKADYRSRLRTLASRVNASADAPPIPTTGYNAVRQGYSTAEEAIIRRAALNQRRPIVRRRLCLAVGLGAGGGVAPYELRLIHRRDICVCSDGILISIPGNNARTIVIRRDYEELVLVGIEGLSDDDLVLDVGFRGPNPVAAIIAAAELYGNVPKIDQRRLRTTWISWLLLQPIPLQLALQAAGLSSARTFSDMAKHLPACTDVRPLRDGGVA